MMDIRQIQAELSADYSFGYSLEVVPVVKTTLNQQAAQWGWFANDYILAASSLDERAPHLWLPRLQVTGQAIESALKACLAAVGVEPPSVHDLVRLYELAAAQGFRLSEPHMAAIVHLGHFYHVDLATSTRYKARFPTSQAEVVGGAVPPHSAFSAIVGSLIRQAKQRSTVPEQW